jgi:hypothetical protein
MDGWKETRDTAQEFTRGDWRITPAVGGGWILLFRGVQQGGSVDSSGAGDRVYPSPESAAADARG